MKQRFLNKSWKKIKFSIKVKELRIQSKNILRMNQKMICKSLRKNFKNKLAKAKF